MGSFYLILNMVATDLLWLFCEKVNRIKTQETKGNKLPTPAIITFQHKIFDWCFQNYNEHRLFPYLLFLLFSEQTVRTYYVQDTILYAGNIAVNNMDMIQN